MKEDFLTSLTCLKVVVHFSINPLILIEGSDLKNFCAYWSFIQNFCMVVEAGELGRVAVTVLYMNHNSGKVPLDRALLVSHLNSKREEPMSVTSLNRTSAS